MGNQKAIILFLFVFFGLIQFNIGQNAAKESHNLVALRYIGHQILLHGGDSTSRVLPIQKNEERYQIQFNGDFAFVPDSLINIIRRAAIKSELKKDYIVEVERCDSGLIVYSFEIRESGKKTILPCKLRALEKACYSIYISFLNTNQKSPETTIENSESNYNIWLFTLTLILVILVLYFKNRKSKSTKELHKLGNLLFDHKRAEIIFKEQRIELTAKEADLLQLLFASANDTVERETILNKVWGDEGDYVGRTLDVFISKLRKKLEIDNKVQIVNTRGVGYKLVLDE